MYLSSFTDISQSWKGKNFDTRICKEAQFCKNVDKVTVLLSAYCIIMLYICTKVDENKFNGFKVIGQTLYSYKITKRA